MNYVWIDRNISGNIHINQELLNKNIENKTEIIEAGSVAELLKLFSEKLKKNKDARLVAIDKYGIAPFIAGCKTPGITAATLSDEHSAHMTREHNDSNLICLGSDVTAWPMMISIINKFLNTELEDQRHMVRINMLRKMEQC